GTSSELGRQVQAFADINGDGIKDVIVQSDRQLYAAYSIKGLLAKGIGTIRPASSSEDKTTAYAYDKAGRRISETVDPNGLKLTTHFEYDAAGNVVAKRDANGNATRFAYDAANRLVGQIDAQGYLTEYRYDALGQKTAETRYATKVWDDTNSPYSSLQRITVGDPGYAGQRWFIDMNNDGRADFIRTVGALSGANSQAAVSYANGQGVINDQGIRFFPITNWGPEGLRWWADVTGDGVGDFIRRTDGGSSAQTTLGNTQGPVNWNLDDWGYPGPRWWVDFDGDGKADYLRAVGEPSGPGRLLRVDFGAEDGTTIRRQPLFLGPGDWGYEDRRWWADFDGDGKADYLRVVGDKTGPNAHLAVTLSTGTGLKGDGAYEAYTLGAIGQANRLEPIDWNGDGKLDLLIYKDDGLYASQFDGQRYSTPFLVNRDLGTSSELGRQVQAFADINGDGIKDVIVQSDRQLYAAYSIKGLLAKGIDAIRPASDSKDQTTTYTYDAANRKLTETTDAVDIRTSPDAAPQRVQLVTRFDYDSMGNLVKRTEAAGIAGMERVSEFAYDRAGRQTTLKQVGFGTVGSTPEVGNDTIYNGTDLNRTSLGETPFTPTSTTYYDSFGNAVAHEDVGGNWRYKSYDKLGRIILETDGEGYLTAYNYDAIGNRTSLVRHATKLDLAPGRKEGYDLNQERSALLLPDRASPYDRAILYRYDQAGRVIETVEPTAYQLNLQGNLVEASATGKTTRNQYNTQGLLIKQSVLVSHVGTTQTWADTTFYYDAAGRKVGQVDAEGYVTQWTYNSLGKMTREVQYAAPLSTQVADCGPGETNTASMFELLVSSVVNKTDPGTGVNRSTRYEYDKLGNRTAEIRENIGGATVNAQGGVSYTNADVATRSRYDQYGNVIETTDARGNRVFNYYDALGRMSHQAQASQRVGNTDHYIVTQYERDAHGNAVRTTRFADTMTLAVGAERPGSLTVPASNSGDRIEQRRFDLAGHQTEYRVDLRAEDGVLGNQILQKTFYDKYGRTALEWHAGKQAGAHKTHVDAGVLLTTNLVKSFEYDRVGNQISTKERFSPPGVVSGDAGQKEKKTEVIYNAFGEITERKLNGITTSQYDYDTAGRIWRRQEAGVWTVQYYNPMGWEVARITSPDENAFSGAITPASLAHTAVLSGNQLQTEASGRYRRTYTRYDKLGRQISQTGPAFTSRAIGNTGLGLQLGSHAGRTVIQTPADLANEETNIKLRYTDKAGQVALQGLVASVVHVDVAEFGLNSGESILLQKVSLPYDYQATAGTSEADLIGHAAGIQHYRLSRINDQYFLNPEEKVVSATYRPTTQARFDRWGNRISLTDASGADTRWHYNSQNQLQDEISATVDKQKNGNSSHGSVIKRYAYSHTGDLIGSWDGNGYLTRQQFDQFGRLARTTHGISTEKPEGWAGDEHAYDHLGRLATTVSNIGDRPLVTTYDYNRLDQRILDRRQGDVNRQALSARATPSGPNWTTKVLLTHYGYDAAGNRVRENHLAEDDTNAQQTTWYAYGTHGKVTDVDVLLSTHAHNTVYSGTRQAFTYDQQGNKTKESTFSRFNNDYVEESKSWQYDLATNRLTSHTDLGGNTYNHYRYNGLGQVDHFNYTVAGKDPITRSHLYDQAGHLIEQIDYRGMDVLGVQRSRYDVMGRVRFESMSRPGKGNWYQATDYDALGRVQAVYGPTVAAQYGYDANSNRTYVKGMQYTNSLVAGIPDKEHHYSYDALNRVVVSRGSVKNGTVEVTNGKGERLSYRGSSQQRTEVWRTTENGNQQDSFTYDSFGQQVDTYRLDTAVNIMHPALKTRREYNYLGQVTLEDSYSADGRLSERTRNAYEVTGQGRLARQETHKLDGKTQAQLDALPLNAIVRLTDYKPSTTVLTNTYKGSKLTNYTYDDYTHNVRTDFSFDHQAFESWREVKQHRTNGTTEGSGTSISTLDDYGNVISVSDPHGRFKQRNMLVDLNGRVLQKTNDNVAAHKVNYLFVGGNTVASSYGAGEEANFDYTSAARTGTQAPNTQSIYTVNQGDTLRTIAFAVWGDSSLWYLIGDANGLTEGADVSQPIGRNLRIPNAVSAANRADTFAPYNPSRLVGDTTPGLPPPPPPPKGKCGGLAQVIGIAVTVMATLATGNPAIGATAGDMARQYSYAAFNNQLDYGDLLLRGLPFGIIGGAILGGDLKRPPGFTKDYEYDYKSTVRAAAAAAISEYGVKDNIGWAGAAKYAVQGTAMYATNYGLNRLQGNDPTFRWREIAGAALGNQLVGDLADSGKLPDANGVVGMFVNKMILGATYRTVQIAINGQGKMEFANIAVSAFGDVLGNSIAGNGRNWVGPAKPVVAPVSGSSGRNWLLDDIPD
ncbi:FG-GAP-like repeat-containing protein, partial [Chitinimonas sp. PSY-7]|uniref:FG-GAP-like repeat-containing protein n=1 Tax=Chitinimonas sp. PSY-7 TaxID=3459088 RepID=UPI0040400900